LGLRAKIGAKIDGALAPEGMLLRFQQHKATASEMMDKQETNPGTIRGRVKDE
jgi:hypothetical protein